MAGENAPAIRVATPGESGRDHIIVSPFQFYVNGEDHLRVTSANSLAGVVLEITGRFFDEDTQKIGPLSDRHTPNTDRSIKQTLVRLGKGYLLNLAVRAVAASPIVGQTFVILELVRGFEGATQFLGVMGSGYVTARQGIAWPGSAVQSSIEGGGYTRAVAGTTPGAGVEISETVPTGARWKLVCFHSRLTASATVSNRFVRLTLDDGTATPYLEHFPPATAQTASQVVPYTFSQGVQPLVGQTAFQASLPVNAQLAAAHRIKTITTGIQVGDQWDQVEMLVEEWLEAN